MLKRIMLLCGVFSPLFYAVADAWAGLIGGLQFPGSDHQ